MKKRRQKKLLVLRQSHSSDKDAALKEASNGNKLSNGTEVKASTATSSTVGADNGVPQYGNQYR